MSESCIAVAVIRQRFLVGLGDVCTRDFQRLFSMLMNANDNITAPSISNTLALHSCHCFGFVLFFFKLPMK